MLLYLIGMPKNKRPVRSVTLRGKRFALKTMTKIDSVGSLGECDDPTAKNKTIKLHKKLKNLDELDTMIHEMLHACFWDIDEGVINEAATDIAKVLWRLGYRKNT